MIAETVEEVFYGNDYIIRIYINGIHIVRATLDPGYVVIESLTKRHKICERLSKDKSATNIDLIGSNYL